MQGGRRIKQCMHRLRDLSKQSLEQAKEERDARGIDSKEGRGLVFIVVKKSSRV
jgi:DNA-binding protein YbaB